MTTDSTITPELLDQLLANYEKPEDLTGDDGLFKQLKKALIERALGAELTGHLGYERGDPVGIGLVSSLAHPGGNVTGLSTVSAELSVKRLELLRDFAPQLSRVAILWDDTNPAFPLTVRHTETAAKSLGLSLQVVAAQQAGSLSNVFAALDKEKAQGLIVAVPLATPLLGWDFSHFIGLAAQRKLPAIYAQKEFVTAGGLASYAPNIVNLFRRAAAYTDKILKGAAPSDLPVEEPTKFETVINLKTAKILGIEVQPLLLVRADEVIE